jgi:hypothetical protein
MNKRVLGRRVASLEDGNSVVFYYLSASEIWPAAFSERGLIRGRGLLYLLIQESV